MSDLDILRAGFVAFIDGLWWGLRDNTGPLSMYEGYERGFKQIGLEHAEKVGGNGPNAAASIAVEVMTAMGLDVEAKGMEVIVKDVRIVGTVLNVHIVGDHMLSDYQLLKLSMVVIIN